MALSKNIVQIAQETSTATLEGVRAFLAGSLDWSAKHLGGLAAAPLVEKTTLAAQIQTLSANLAAASGQASQALTSAIANTGAALQKALDALDSADGAIKRTLFENIQVASVVGDSFAGLVTTADITPSFRLNGRDASAAEVVADWKRSGLPRLILCVPGLFCDETLWGAGEPALAEVMQREGYYPLYVRFNPGAHISVNGRALLQLTEDLFDLADAQDQSLMAVSYSQGGLILRSALYYGKLSGARLPGRIQHALLVNSPDGGSYIEKLGFWLGFILESAPIAPVKLLGFIGNQRSDAMKDLSHGIIREEDWLNGEHLDRYKQELYFGELDDIMATQIYSLAAEEESLWASWIGDGIVEHPSLTLLTDRVYRKKSDPAARVVKLIGKSHFQVMAAAETRETLERILRASALSR